MKRIKSKIKKRRCVEKVVLRPGASMPWDIFYAFQNVGKNIIYIDKYSDGSSWCRTKRGQGVLARVLIPNANNL